MALSGIAMGFAAFGLLAPVAGALTQELIDVAVILNALRALTPGRRHPGRAMPGKVARDLRREHRTLELELDALRAITDALDDAGSENAVALIAKAKTIVEQAVVAHERADEDSVYPRLTKYLADGHALTAMSRAHREILHLARLLARMSNGLEPTDVDKYLIHDAQRVIESIETLVRIHNAQEEDIYDYAVAA